MSTLTYGSPQNELSYRPGLILEAELSTVFSAFDGSDDLSSAFLLEDRPGQGRGTNLTRKFSKINRDEAPKIKGAPIVGVESTESEFTDAMDMRYFSFDGYIDNYVAEQNMVSYDLKAQRVARLALQWAYLKEKWVINQLTGNTLVNTAADYGLSGGNIVTAQDAAHTVYAPDASGGANANDAAVAADVDSAVLDTRIIDNLVTRAGSLAYVEWPIAPCDTPFGPLYVLVCHGTGYEQIKANSSGSDFFTIAQAAIQGGLDLSMSPLITGEGFIYDKTLVLKSDFCPQGITGGAAQANTRVATFFGANAGAWMNGEGYTDGDHLGYSEHMIHRRLSILTDTMRGFKRTIVNGQSWASFRVVHYSAV